MPLMRYTDKFKLNVPIDSFDLPYRSILSIILGEAGNGEEFNYTVDRATTLISIGVLAADPPGPICACAFLAVKSVSFFNRWYTAYRSGQSAESEAQNEEPGPTSPKQADDQGKQPLLAADGQEKQGVETNLSG